MKKPDTKVEDERLEKFKDNDKPASKQAWRLLFSRYKTITKNLEMLSTRIEGVAAFAKITDCEVNALMGTEIARRPHLLGPSPYVGKTQDQEDKEKKEDEDALPWSQEEAQDCRLSSGKLCEDFDATSKICDNCANAVAIESVDQDDNEAYSVIMCGEKRSGHFNKEMGPTQTCYYFEHYSTDSPYYGWAGDLDDEDATGGAGEKTTKRYITPESQAMIVNFDSKGRPAVGAITLLENDKTKPRVTK